MRVSIDHKEKSTGLVFKKPLFAVSVSVQFSEEEKAIINARKLKNYVVLERDWDAKMKKAAEAHPEYYDTVKPPHLMVSDLMRGTDTYTCPDPVRAKQYEAQLVEALKTLKSFLEGSQSLAESKTFEL